jgi:hypothetical protein
MAAQGSQNASQMAIAMSARPARLGLLVPAAIKGISWLAMFESALAAQSRFWGGAGNLIFPLGDDLTESEVFWAIAEAFDPDAFVTYSPTFGELETITPEYYASQIESWAKQIGAGSEGFERYVSDARGQTAVTDAPSAAQLALIRRRLAPFHGGLGDEWELERYDSSNPVGWPFTDISGLAELPREVDNPLAPPGAARRLLLTATLGRLPEAFAAQLAGLGVTVREQPISKYEAPLWVRDRMRTRTESPWSLTGVGLLPYRRRPLMRTPAALVVGESPWDFALFYALNRMTGKAWWLPSWLARDDGYLVSLAQAMEHDVASEARQVRIVSTSSEARCEEIAARFARLHLGGGLQVGDWREAIPDEPERLYARDSEGRPRVVTLFDGEVAELDTPIPKYATTPRPIEMRWIAEVRGSDWLPIRHEALGARLLPAIGSDTEFVRTSSDGLAYFSMASLVGGGTSLENAVLRPRLRPLGLQEQIAEVLAPAGWRCGDSDKGIYARESMRLFGDLERLCAALRDDRIRAVIEAFREGGKAPVLSHDRRRYLTWGHFEELLGEETSATIHPLVESGVLSRGVVLKCRRCRQASWHRSGLVTDVFVCERCDLEQAVDRQAWFGTDEPLPSYRLAEVLLQLLENHGELPMLAARDEFAESRRPGGQSFELEIVPPGRKGREIDIFRSDGNRLWIGEASVSGKLEEAKLEFLAEVAVEVNAWGVLLATSEPTWQQGTRERAAARFCGRRPTLVMRAGVRTGPQPDGSRET